MSTKHENVCVDTLVAAKLLLKTKKDRDLGKRTEDDVRIAREEFLDALAEAMTLDPAISDIDLTPSGN